MAVGQVRVTTREVTDEEVAFFWEHQWVYLSQLISAELAVELLARAKRMMGESGDAHAVRPGLDTEIHFFANYFRPDADDDVVCEYMTNEQLGRNAARLLGRDMGIRLMSSLFAVKLPSARREEMARGTGATDWHQDTNLGPVRGGAVTIWVALDEVTPEMGSMRFYDRSHVLGDLAPPTGDWPRLQEFELSPPLRLRPGDATAHGNFIVHGAPENTTDRPRWACITSLIPAHAQFNGKKSIVSDELYAAGELEVGEPLDHPRFPVLYAGP